MAEYKAHRVPSLPATLETDSVYYTQTGVPGELQVTVVGNTLSDVYSTVTSNDILTLMNKAVYTATIATRDALGLTANELVLVGDATADPNVASGSALYFYKHDTTEFILLQVLDNVNMVVDWGDIQNVPTVLNGLADDGNGNLTYLGNSISTGWTTTDW